MDEIETPDAALVDLRGISLSELRSLLVDDDSAFAHCLHRLANEVDDPDYVAMVAFESTV